MKYCLTMGLSIVLLFAFVVSRAQTGAALNFDGVDDYVDISAGKDIPAFGPVTVEAWLKYTTGSGPMTWFKRGTTNGYGLYLLNDTLHVINYLLGDWKTGVGLSAGSWTHIGFTFDGFTERIYANGLLAASHAGGYLRAADSILIGAGFNAPAAGYFRGSIDELRVWNRALSACELVANMHCGISASFQNGLVALFHFNQGVAEASNSTEQQIIDSASIQSPGNLYHFALSGASSNWIAPGAIVSGNFCSASLVSISLSSGSNPACVGNSLSFTAKTLNLTGNIHYQWIKNGVAIPGATGDNYGSDKFENGDSLRCEITDIMRCGSSLASNGIKIAIRSRRAPEILITSNAFTAICTGNTVTFNALAIRGGDKPIFQWTKNSVIIPGALDSMYITNALVNTDTFRCLLTSNDGCLSTGYAVSTPEVIMVSPEFRFNGSGNWDDAANWQNKLIPPVRLPACASIIIDPAAGGTCILNREQSIANGGSLTVLPGKKFTVLQNLLIDNNPEMPYLSSPDTAGEVFFGLEPTPLDELKKVPLAERLDDSLFPNLLHRPAEVLESFSLPMPPVGDQQKSGSCTGWAVGYAVLGYHRMRLEHNYLPDGSPDYSEDDKRTSPVFIWNKLNGGQNVGVSIKRALDFFEQNGNCKWVDMRGDLDVALPPSTQATFNAFSYIDQSFFYSRMWKIDTARLKLYIRNGYPIPFGAVVDESFVQYNRTNIVPRKGSDGKYRFVYEDYGSWFAKKENHAMTLCGYDDKLNAFKVMNSWGLFHGDGGFYWIDYDFFKEMVISSNNGLNPEIYLPIFTPSTLSLGTTEASDITTSDATSGMTINSSGDAIIHETGLCYSTTHNPTTAWGDNRFATPGSPGTISLTKLDPGVIYYVRAYAKTDEGMVYGNEVTFRTLPLPNVSVRIGTQVWMSKNLDVAAYRNGDAIPEVEDFQEWSDMTTGAWCYYNNDPANGPIYGRLYNWYAVNDPRGLAPEGWHIPTDAEWTTLSTYLGGDLYAGGKMKTNYLWNQPNLNATNESGFTALPGGSRCGNVKFSDMGMIGYWWSASPGVSAYDALMRYIYQGGGALLRFYLGNACGISVRCVKD